MTHATPKPLRNIKLEDKFSPGPSRVYMTGIDALVRLPLLQHEIDIAAGLKTGGFISGYRGSPLGGLDQALWAARHHLDAHSILFNPAVNEELGATSVWGSQQVGIVSESEYDGVFGMWYGKGPGVDRSMDAIKHANAFGTSPHGGVLAIAGDDHACKSSTLPHQSEHMFIGASVPVLAPANVQEVLDFGVYGWAMSRFTGCWVALKAITDNMDAAMGVEINRDRYSIRIPPPEAVSPDGMHARWPDPPLDQERRLNLYKIYAARLFASINGLNRIALDSTSPALGIATSGKAYLDVMEALRSLGITEQIADKLGIRVLKIGMPWPLDPEIIQVFASGLREILVVEEKRSVIEDQLTSQLYNLAGDDRPKIFGEFDHRGELLLGNTGELDPDVVANAIASRLDELGLRRPNPSVIKPKSELRPPSAPVRTPHYCSGCPHNTSTKVPEGSVAMGGIGCHYMATWMPDRDTRTFSQMGGEGAAWIGQAPFSNRNHVFQNLGDGTYFHSGSLAIRAAVASQINITYKLLFNEAVAMTGGQAIDGSLSLHQLLEQIRAEGVEHIAVVSEEIGQQILPDFVEACGRADYNALQKRYATLTGTSVIVYQQLCATEKRRRQKRKQLPPADTRVYIHPELCEGCGDCGAQSNCLSIQPLETELGTKRIIDQHSCNTDLSCVDGFCPSFITVPASANREPTEPILLPSTLFDPLPQPEIVSLKKPWNALVAGIGGTGVLTVSSILAMAAHIEGKGFATMNQTGLAQKYGSVVSHVKIAENQHDILAIRVKDQQADLLVACDAAVASSRDALDKLGASCGAVVNTHMTETRDFLYSGESTVNRFDPKQLIGSYLPEGNVHAIEAIEHAIQLVGDAIGANLFLVGIASQKGLLPISPEAIERAIEVNGVAVGLNKDAFLWGRRFAFQPESVRKLIKEKDSEQLRSLDEIIAERKVRLTAYQNSAYAEEYEQYVRSASADLQHVSGVEELKCELARQLYRLMALKDEYEVARLLTSKSYIEGFTDVNQPGVNFYFAPPVLSRWFSRNGRPRKVRIGSWARYPLKSLAMLKFLRRTPLDPFGYGQEKRAEQSDLSAYLDDIKLISEATNSDNIESARQLAACVSTLRGYGHVRSKNRESWLVQRARYRAELELIQPLHLADVNHRGINEK